jgi:hypothetical protein
MVFTYRYILGVSKSIIGKFKINKYSWPICKKLKVNFSEGIVTKGYYEIKNNFKWRLLTPVLTNTLLAQAIVRAANNHPKMAYSWKLKHYFSIKSLLILDNKMWGWRWSLNECDIWTTASLFIEWKFLI